MINIIIPTYNNLDTIGRALASIASQTVNKKVIVTVVDDASTEDISSIINIYKEILPLKYIKLEKNLKYPGLVRQVGIDCCDCEYILFLDADDMLLPTAIESLNAIAQNTKADFILGAFLEQDGENKYKKIGEEGPTWLHGNLYKKSMLDKFNIRFPAMYNEDGGFNTQVLLLAENKLVASESVCIWMNNKNSITRSSEDWLLRNANPVVQSLTQAYYNILNFKNDDEVYVSVGRHIGFFYNYYSMIKYFDRIPEAEEMLNKVKEFVMILGVEGIENEKSFKSGLLLSYEKFPMAKGIYREFSLGQFLDMIGLNPTFKYTDFEVKK